MIKLLTKIALIPRIETKACRRVKIDYHIHTQFSDGTRALTDYVSQAVNGKIDEIGFSDHMHFKKAVWSMNFSDLPNYVTTTNSLKKSSEIAVKIGLEVDFIPSRMDELMQTIRKFNFDYLIGSIHFLGSWPFDTENQIDEWRKKNIDQVYQQYFSLVQRMANSRLFDIVGHLDLVKIFNFRPENDITNLLHETVETIRKNKMCVEVNTSGLRKPCKEIYPSEKLLKICFDNGLPVTLGSDAHSPSEVGADYDKAESLLRNVGCDEIVRFTRRNRELVEL